ncbi:D-isomer specific 2-hydroxyacid dehydrogenase NAD-binding protein [Kribbella flavida DSM 17836]|uniref:D-isomer specific 2-hydroxyacid dehydrogenase NAD-binding protein n=1 Tax=Kribbella flavida (strain DSM 17836 / JCM 10339 / NBRC 14399) TaxID=479435 RepID=D2PZS0_KRIFD|nr:2-hydroxyacid dehydrogenase [Kribbella flavida]ADB35636.1 D-isomer specific 2-hydroxyacid dehydrogenase NAD-binding protein [Kribbella flavida DSM 17836]
MRTVKTLLAGDHFVRNDLLADALSALPDVTFDFREVTLPWPLTPFGPVAEVDEASDAEDALIEALPGVELAITQMGPFTERVLQAAPDLRFLVCCRGGPVNVNVPAATERGITVASTPGRNAVAAAEHAVALMMGALRKLPQLQRTLEQGAWRSDLYAYDECGSELDGATVGLIGYGAIGQRVSRVMLAFGAKVLVVDPAYDAASPPEGTEVVGLDELLGRSDVVSLHARLTEQTRGMIGADQLARMRRGAVLVNTARGGLLDYEATVDALESGQLGAAAFDVFPAEPLPAGSRLLTAPNVVMTPHLAGATRQTARRAGSIAAEAVAAYLAGRAPVRV